MILENDKYRVKIEIDTTYTVKSTDNRKYDLIFQLEDYQKGYMYKAFIIDVESNGVKQSVILVRSYLSEVYQCAVLEDNKLIVLMYDTIIMIDMKILRIIKKAIITDFGVCFAIYKFKDGYIIRGELEVIKLDSDINIEWKFTGADIFVTSKEDNFVILEDEIIIEDWQGYVYHIDENGNEITQIN